MVYVRSDPRDKFEIKSYYMVLILPNTSSFPYVYLQSKDPLKSGFFAWPVALRDFHGN